MSTVTIERNRLSGTKRWKILFVLLIAVFAYLCEGTMIYGAIPAFYRVFNQPGLVGWVMAAYFIVGGIFAAVCGALGDAYGRKSVLAGTLLVSSAGGVIAAAAPNLYVMVAGHAVQGIAFATVPLCIGLLHEHVDPGHLPLFVGILTVPLTASAGLIFMIGGLILDHWGWRWVFGAGAGALFLGSIAVMWAIPASARVRRSAEIDWQGGLLLALGMTSLLFSITLARSAGWFDLPVVGIFIASVAVLTLWAAWELGQKSPLINVRVLAQRQVALTMVVYALMALGSLQFGTVILMLLQQSPETGIGFGTASATAGAMLIPMSLIGLVAGPVSGYIAGRRGARLALICAIVVAMFGWFGILSCRSALWLLLAATLVVGWSNSALFPSIANLLLEISPADEVSAVTAIGETIRAMFMGVGAQIVAVVLASTTIRLSSHDTGTFPTDQAYVAVMTMVIGMICVAIGAAFFLPTRRPKYAIQAASSENA